MITWQFPPSLSTEATATHFLEKILKGFFFFPLLSLSYWIIIDLFLNKWENYIYKDFINRCPGIHPPHQTHPSSDNSESFVWIEFLKLKPWFLFLKVYFNLYDKNTIVIIENVDNQTIQKTKGGLPGGPVVKNPPSSAGGCGLDPWSGN